MVLAAGGIFFVGLMEICCLAFAVFVRAVVTGDDFVGLARLNYFVSRWAWATFVSEFRFRGILLGFRSFLLERHGGELFVALAPLIVLFISCRT